MFRKTGRSTKSRNTANLGAMHRRQNPSDSGQVMCCMKTTARNENMVHRKTGSTNELDFSKDFLK
jgi:hypothetical protein